MPLHKAQFVGILPYSVVDNEPIVLIWKHSYVSPITRANTTYFTELICRKNKFENSKDAASRMLSTVTTGIFIQNKKDNQKKNNLTIMDKIETCRKQILHNIESFKGIAMLESDNGYIVYMIPVKYVKIEKIHSNLQQSLYVSTCEWVSLPLLLKIIYETNIQHYVLPSFENWKLYNTQKQNNTAIDNNNIDHTDNNDNNHKPSMEYHKLSVSFCFMLRKANEENIFQQLFHDLKLNVVLNNDNINIDYLKTIALNDGNNYDIHNKNGEKPNNIDESSNMTTQNNDTGEINKTICDIHCKKCRKKILNNSHLLLHSQLNLSKLSNDNENDNNNNTHENNKDNNDINNSSCGCLFLDVEKPETYVALNDMCNFKDMSGQLRCPKCKAKIGHFDYCGLQCPCGEWICPAFQLSSSKIDVHCKNHLT